MLVTIEKFLTFHVVAFMSGLSTKELLSNFFT